MNSAERRVLWASIEDYAGLWELVWELKADHPLLSEAERRIIAERIVRELLARDCLLVYERRMPGSEKLVPKELWDTVLRKEENWSEPTGTSIEVLVAATAEGEQLYRAAER